MARLKQPKHFLLFFYHNQPLFSLPPEGVKKIIYNQKMFSPIKKKIHEQKVYFAKLSPSPTFSMTERAL